MNRSTRTIVVVAVAIVTAAIASLGMFRVLSAMPAQEASIETIDTVVAAHPLQLGTRLTKDHIKIVKWPAATPMPGAHSSAAEVLNRGVIDSIGENEPLTESKLAPLESGAGLPPSIPAGMRAISVKVNEVIGVAGFVVPGTRVDVMVTLSSRKQEQDSMSRVVVSNVQVLTAGTRYDQEKAKEGTPIPSTVVTLLVNPSDAERIALASSEGQIMLALRNPLDTDVTATTGVRTTGLFGQAPAPAKPAVFRMRKAEPLQPIEVAPAPVVKAYTVEAIRGAKRSEEVVR
jgi:pilus assembly protein CpaB